MIEKQPPPKSVWKRRLSVELPLHSERRREAREENIGADITAFVYKTGMSLCTETRVQLQVNNDEPFIEIHQDDRGNLVVEVQGLEAYGVIVRLSPLPNQKIESDENLHRIE